MLPREMAVAPPLDPDAIPRPMRRRYALLIRTLEAQRRLVHRDWRLYDTAHVVFEPKRMTAEELQSGYEWCYERLFSHRSIWRRRPRDWRAVLPYLAMSYLYKRSNRIWHSRRGSGGRSSS